MNRSADIPVLVLQSSPRERGRVHGETLRAQIAEFNARWREDIHTALGTNPDRYIEQLVAENDFIRAVKKWSPDLLEEVQGIAEGSGVDFQTMFARQLSDEDWWFRLEKKYGPVEATTRQCSSLGVYGQADGSTIVAQNMDTPAFWDGFQALLHVKHPSGLEAFVFTAAGGIGLCGMNSRGVGICCNTILQCDYSHTGLPVAFVVRSVLAQSSLADAVGFVRRVRHASAQNYIIGDPARAVDLEVSANQVCEFAPHAGLNRVYHTNHPLVNDDQGMFRARLAVMPLEKREAFLGRSTTEARLSSLEQHLSDPTQTLTVDKIKTALRSHDGPVCRDPGDYGLTLGCCVMELAPAPRFHLAAGPPCSTDFKTYSFLS